MSDPAVTADDLYGDLGSVSAAPAPPPPPPAAEPASAALEEENAALRARVAALETEARVWAAQRAVLVGNLGALLKTAKAVDARRVREISALREQAAGAARALPQESRQAAPEQQEMRAPGAGGGGGGGVDNRAGEARGAGLWRAREGYGDDRRMRGESRNGMRRDEDFLGDGARRGSARYEERPGTIGESSGGEAGRREPRFGGPLDRREDAAGFYGSDGARRRSYDERRRGDDRREGYR